MSNSNKLIRFKQRFQNFESNFKHFKSALNIKGPSITERAGLIQFYEMTFDLAWKTLKDLVEANGEEGFQTPREVIKKAFQLGYLQEGREWLKALDDRNITSHVYDEDVAIQVEETVRKVYAPLLEELYIFLKNKTLNHD